MICWLKIVFKTYLYRYFHINSNKIYCAKGIRKNVVRGSWQNCHYGQLTNFLKKFCSTLFTIKKILEDTKFHFKIIRCSRVLRKTIPPWYIVPLPGPNRKINFENLRCRVMEFSRNPIENVLRNTSSILTYIWCPIILEIEENVYRFLG